MRHTFSYEEVCAELDGRQWITLGLDRVEALLDALDNPQRKLRIAQVVGTNGKGTTAVALADALGAEGHSAGVYLSPHLISYTERLRLDGREATEQEFASAMGRAIRAADERGVQASQFELLTAGALAAFAEAGLSWAVLEAGLGARHDATSAAGAEAVILTNVGLDHTEYLGDTIEEISAEKLASLQPGSTLILGSGDSRVQEISRHECDRVWASLVEAWDADLESIQAPLLPPYAKRNVALGLRTAATILGRELTPETAEETAAGAGLPGRFERVEHFGVPVVVDGGHNPTGLAAALDGVRTLYPGLPLGVVFGALRDKDIPSMLAALRDRADSLTLARPDNVRAAEPGWMQREFEPLDSGGREPTLEYHVGEALDVAATEMKKVGGVVLVTGSLYTAADALRHVRGERS